MLENLLEKILFRPVVLPQDFRYSFESPFTEYFLEPEKDVSINVLHFKAKDSKGLLLYFHGNKDNLNRWGAIAQEFTTLDLDVVILDYRGYGKSMGIRSEESLYQDALFCYEDTIKRYNPKEIILMGRSLGTGIASWLANKVQKSKLILETPYYDMQDLMGAYLPKKLLKAKLSFHLRTHEYLKKTNFPILILQGTKDGVVPHKSAQKLYKSLDNPNASFITFKGGNHNNLVKFPKYWPQIKKFIS